tara:strand:- start:1889 stop:2152 length:264 start_codon:yes stop_codon:yes gene_type:complete
MTNDLKQYYMSLPTNIQELQEKCYAEHLARRKVEAHYERQLKLQLEKYQSFLSQKLKDQIEELKAENRQLKDQLSNEGSSFVKGELK